ncbi:MAG TPA: OB-fold domain-containing protein [Nitrolancea sp.]|nr:OB-fold domain-containing protein [Nitrolancea sp.]
MVEASTSTYEGASGTIVSFTIINVPTPEFAGEAPYGLLVLDMSDGERLLARSPVSDNDNLAIGAQVVFDHSDAHGPVFRVQ